MKVSLRAMLHQYGNSVEKVWAHDRSSTVGGSEVGQCIRHVWFDKNGVPRDPTYLDNYGARMRGDLIEEHYWVPGLRATLPEGVQLLYAGGDQKTLVDGYLSATSDGLLVGVTRDCLKEDFGIDDIGDESLVVECKSIDPRVDIRIEKPEHSFQTQVQLGLLRHSTPYKPNYALISYTDASFLDDVREFVVRFDPDIYEAAKTRARRIMTADSALELSPEGKIAGADECQYCAWKSHCANAIIAGIPKEGRKTLGANAMAQLRALRDAERKLAIAVSEYETAHGRSRQDIKDFLRENGVRKVLGEDGSWSVSWFPAKGRELVDTKAAEASGVDLTAFKKKGEPGDRLIVK